MSQEKQRIHDIRRRLELVRLERARQNLEFEELERAVAPGDVKLAEALLQRSPRRERTSPVPFNPGLRA